MIYDRKKKKPKKPRIRGYRALPALLLLACAPPARAPAADASTDPAALPAQLADVKCVASKVGLADCVVCGKPGTTAPALSCEWPEGAK